ncbi:phage integrase SAM-like domain-containing protein, partial [Prevotella sp. S7-1-8]|uniref:phage integrase SAM-like domain-containing protein n=2 Tax=Prevotella TaxID=838 RepID=UPI00056B8D10
MMRSTFKTLFYINRQKTKANGLTSILCRITIDGKNSVITTNEECKPAEWNIKQGPTTDKKINLRLQSFRELVEKTYQELLLKDRVVSAELLKNRLQGIATYSSTLLGLGRAELQMVKEGVGKSKAEGTYTNLCYANRMLCEFIKDLESKDIEIQSVTEELFEEYRFFLKKKGLKGSSINNYLCWLSRLMFRAVSQRIIRYNPFEHAEYEKVEKAIRFLSKSDVKNLMAMKM